MIDGTANIVQTKKFIKAGEGGIRKVKTQKKKKVLDTERRNGWLASRQNPYSNCFSDARWCDAMHPSYIFSKEVVVQHLHTRAKFQIYTCLGSDFLGQTEYRVNQQVGNEVR